MVVGEKTGSVDDHRIDRATADLVDHDVSREASLPDIRARLRPHMPYGGLVWHL